jgi:hypothetical protein
MITIKWMMFVAFIAALALSAWKVYLFLPSKPLQDDDTTFESVKLLEKIMLECNRSEMDEDELFEAMLHHLEFDPHHFWRFNPNRLRHLIQDYRLSDPNFRR